MEKYGKPWEKNSFPNETNITQQSVTPTLSKLGWPTDDIEAEKVKYEFTLGKGRADIALFNEDRLLQVVIGVKKPGGADGAEKQLFEYTYHIANRGEIACRIIKMARRVGARSGCEVVEGGMAYAFQRKAWERANNEL